MYSNKAVGPGKNSKLRNIGPSFIPKSRVAPRLELVDGIIIVFLAVMKFNDLLILFNFLFNLGSC